MRVHTCAQHRKAERSRSGAGVQPGLTACELERADLLASAICWCVGFFTYVYASVGATSTRGGVIPQWGTLWAVWPVSTQVSCMCALLYSASYYCCCSPDTPNSAHQVGSLTDPVAVQLVPGLLTAPATRCRTYLTKLEPFTLELQLRATTTSSQIIAKPCGICCCWCSPVTNLPALPTNQPHIAMCVWIVSLSASCQHVSAKEEINPPDCLLLRRHFTAARPKVTTEDWGGCTSAKLVTMTKPKHNRFPPPDQRTSHTSANPALPLTLLPTQLFNSQGAVHFAANHWVLPLGFR